MAMLLYLSLSLLLSSLPLENAFSTRNLDNLLQDYAFKALSSPKTGLPYDAKLPNNLLGVQVSAMNLTSGVQNYKEESNEESSVVHLWKKSKKSKKSKKNKSKSKNKNKKKAKKMNKNLEAGLITAILCLIGLCIVLILVWLLVVKLRKKKLQEKALEFEKNNEALKIKHDAGTV
ncbi:cell adhesion molecule-related/down-regulated by oncogenes [Trifolium repens]|nr:cell adhesion molecule-related/down-regulated by oncogenes [Trifolium repens]